jgi:hypothetical protein
LWRAANPGLTADERQALVDQLMTARRGIRFANASGDDAAKAHAHAVVDLVKRELGERGSVWWTDGAPDFNRHMVRNSPYADWFAKLSHDV